MKTIKNFIFNRFFASDFVTIVSAPPKGNRPVDRSMKLANEIAPYIKVREDGNIEITVKKINPAGK